MSKHQTIIQKRNELRQKRLDRIKRMNRYQIDLGDYPNPELVIDEQEIEPMIIAHLPITEEMTYEISSSDTPTGQMPEDEPKELVSCDMRIETPCPSPVDIILPVESWGIPTNLQVEEPLISAKILAQAEDLRKLMLLQETIKRFSKRK